MKIFGFAHTSSRHRNPVIDLHFVVLILTACAFAFLLLVQLFDVFQREAATIFRLAASIAGHGYAAVRTHMFDIFGSPAVERSLGAFLVLVAPAFYLRAVASRIFSAAHSGPFRFQAGPRNHVAAAIFSETRRAASGRSPAFDQMSAFASLRRHVKGLSGKFCGDAFWRFFHVNNLYHAALEGAN